MYEPMEPNMLSVHKNRKKRLPKTTLLIGTYTNPHRASEAVHVCKTCRFTTSIVRDEIERYRVKFRNKSYMSVDKKRYYFVEMKFPNRETRMMYELAGSDLDERLSRLIWNRSS